MSLRRLYPCVWAAAILQGCASVCIAYTTVLISTAAPAGIETQFLADTTNQFQASLSINPLASNTYTLKIYGVNPTFNGPPTTLEQALSLGATVYVYGFVDGQSYERRTDLGIIGSYALTLSTADANCAPIIGNMENQIYTMNFSTPTVIPPTGGF